MNLKVAIRFLALFFLLASGCTTKEETTPLLIFSETFDFNESEHNWSAGFADLPAGPDDSTRFELRFAYTDQPAGLLTRKSIMLSGNNLNRDLFMYIKRKVSGLAPNREYIITFNVELASNLTLDAGISSGSVYLKAGATRIEPKSVIESGNFVMNIDKGDGTASGEDMVVLGEIRSSAETVNYATVSLNNTMAKSRYVTKSNSNGELWLIIGTESTLEGTTTILYSSIAVVFSAS